MPGSVWLTYEQAAKRIGRHSDSVRRWRRDGLEFVMRDGKQMVLEEHLLAFYRDRLKAWPIHRHKMNRLRAEDGLPPLPPPPPRIKPERVAQRQIQQVPAEDDTDQDQPEPEKLYEPLDGMLDRFAAAAEHTALLEALKANPAPCKDVAGFIADRPDSEKLRPICASCPVLAQCDAYAVAAKIRAGFWAGVDRGRSVRTESAEPSAVPTKQHHAA
ncbi:WhiB family transcriptional regulator [Microbacterium enclense]|uniref:WhiB family transcriptional regulator n=1 Tax=Microbacterium enclense TaxID=993073 RepID=UPI003F7F288F